MLCTISASFNLCNLPRYHRYTRSWSHQRILQRHQRLGTFAPPNVTQVNVKVGGNGHITLDIHQALEKSILDPVILYLPNRPLDKIFSRPLYSNAVSTLSRASGATIVQINYRLDTRHPYPSPIHDVLAGYDWVLEHLVRGPGTTHSAWQKFTQPAQTPCVGVFGELLGGSLAAMLGLTECWATDTGISAMALGNPIVDWTFPVSSVKRSDADLSAKSGVSESTKKSPRRECRRECRRAGPNIAPSTSTEISNGQLSMQELIAARNAFFSQPEQYFDPFASPLLFFRTPGINFPSETSEGTTIASPKNLENYVLETRKRRSHRRYPPLGSNLKIPRMRLDIGEGNELKHQGIEFVELMKRSLGLYEGSWRNDEGLYGDSPDGLERLDADRITLMRREGSGLWSERDFAELGEWFRSVSTQR